MLVTGSVKTGNREQHGIGLTTRHNGLLRLRGTVGRQVGVDLRSTHGNAKRLRTSRRPSR